MTRFDVLNAPCVIGFQEHAAIDLLQEIEPQLHRRKLVFRSGLEKGNIQEIIKIIEWNSSLRIAFGWSFESLESFQAIMDDCENHVSPVFVGNIVRMITDNRCDWLGFEPFNVFDRLYYEKLCVEDLIEFNNNLIDYQVRVVKFITDHKIYRDHAIVRDATYRFQFFKDKRQDPFALSLSFQYYVDAVLNLSGIKSIPRYIIEEAIGCHFLYNPDVFFELLQFYRLKGSVYE